MKRIKSFQTFISRGRVTESQVFDRSELINFLKPFLQDSLYESDETIAKKSSKKRIDAVKMAEEMARIIAKGETHPIRNLRGIKITYPASNKLAEFFLDVLDVIIAKYYSMGFFQYLDKEEIEQIKSAGLESILGDWHKTDLSRTPNQIFGWIYALGNRGVAIAARDLTEKWKKKKEYEKTALGMERIIKDIEDDVHSEDMDRRVQGGSTSFESLEKIPLDIREEVYKCLNRIDRCSYDDVLKSIDKKGIKGNLSKKEFEDLKTVFELTRK